MAEVWFRAHHSDFRRALGMVMGAVDFGSTIPILGHVMFSVADDVLVLRASNLDLQVDAECEVFESVGHASFCLPGDRLKALSSSLPESGEIIFGSGRFNDQVSIRSGKANLSIPFLPAQDFPCIGTGDGADWYDVDGNELSRGISNASFAFNKRDDRAYLAGMCFHASKIGKHEVLTLVATDGISLARIHCPAIPEPRLPERRYSYPHVIVPPRAVDSLRKMFDGALRGCSLATSDALIMARRDGVTMISKLIDGTYPGYEGVISPTRTQFVEAATVELTAAVRRVNIVIDDQKHDAMRVVVTSSGIQLDLVGETGGIAVEEVACEVSAPIDFQVGINGAQLLKLLSSIGTDRVRIYFTDAATPIVIVPVGIETDIFVLQVMRFRSVPGREAQ
ncbi:DNA polymerase III subunit beta [Rhizobium wuzhouense]|nr:DNA polymerase III subunit beta [Rhizobium wuzhouense]